MEEFKENSFVKKFDIFSDFSCDNFKNTFIETKFHKKKKVEKIKVRKKIKVQRRRSFLAKNRFSEGYGRKRELLLEKNHFFLTPQPGQQPKKGIFDTKKILFRCATDKKLISPTQKMLNERKKLFAKYTKVSTRALFSRWNLSTEDNSETLWTILRQKVREIVKNEEKKTASFNLHDIMKTAMAKQQQKEMKRRLRETKSFTGLFKNKNGFSKHRLSCLKRNINIKRFRNDQEKKKKEKQNRMKIILKSDKEKPKKVDVQECTTVISEIFKKNRIEAFKPYIPPKQKVFKKMFGTKLKLEKEKKSIVDDIRRSSYSYEGRDKEKRVTNNILFKFQRMMICNEENEIVRNDFAAKYKFRRKVALPTFSKKKRNLGEFEEELPNSPSEIKRKEKLRCFIRRRRVRKKKENAKESKKEEKINV